MSHEAKEIEVKDGLPWKYLIIMASVTFMAILSELVPSGILPEMSESLGVSYSKIGLLVSWYAIASAVGTIPLVALTVEINRRNLLTSLMVGFAVSNFIIAFSDNYTIIAAARLFGGIFAGVLWPMVSAYAMKLVKPEYRGRAITITMAGCTLGMGIGLPVMTTIGTKISWRVEFIVMAAIIAIIAFFIHTVLPAVPGEAKTKANSPFTIVRNPAVLVVLGVTLLTIMAHYGIYTYIAPLVEEMKFAGGIEIASLIFGIGTIISVFIATKFIDSHLGLLNLGMLLLALLTFALFVFFKGAFGISHVAFFIWGISFGSLVAIFQAAVTGQVKVGKDVATSLQSSTFNFGIVIGSALGAAILDKASVFYIVWTGIGLLVIPILLSVFCKRAFFAPEET